MYHAGQIIISTDISEIKQNFFTSEHPLLPCISEVIGAGNTAGQYKQKLKIVNEKLHWQCI